jgi:hypothetical protein
MALTLLTGFGSSAAAGDFDADAHHPKLTEAFNNRQWEEVKSLLADDSVFHRANATEVYSAPDAIVDPFEQPIDQFTGNDGRVVERGDFAITAGADDSACYAGSYVMTWAPQGSGDDWKLQILSWQDLETSLENCK